METMENLRKHRPRSGGTSEPNLEVQANQIWRYKRTPAQQKHYVRLTIFGIQLQSAVGSHSKQPVGTSYTTSAASAVLGSFFADHQKGDGLLPGPDGKNGPIGWSSNTPRPLGMVDPQR